MAKQKQEKTNVMRILDQKKITYTAHFYDESQGPEGTREYGAHVARPKEFISSRCRWRRAWI